MERRKDLAIWLALVLSIFAVYARVGHSDFINYDDDVYVYNNVHVREGLTFNNIRWAFTAVVSLHDLLKPTPLFRAGSWLLLCVALCWFAWRRGNTREGAFALGTCGSAVIYVMSYYLVGLASDFRYAYWAVLAGLAGAVIVAVPSGRPQKSAKGSSYCFGAAGSDDAVHDL